MLKRVLLATVLLLAGVPMLGDADSVPVGLLLIAVGLAVLMLPSYVRRSRAGERPPTETRTN
jgi:hypothetical protein